MCSDKSRVYNSDTSNWVLCIQSEHKRLKQDFSQFELVLVTERGPDQPGQQSETCSQIDKQMKKCNKYSYIDEKINVLETY